MVVADAARRLGLTIAGFYDDRSAAPLGAALVGVGAEPVGAERYLGPVAVFMQRAGQAGADHRALLDDRASAGVGEVGGGGRRGGRTDWTGWILGIGRLADRRRLLDVLGPAAARSPSTNDGVGPVTIVHPRADVSSAARLGAGVLVGSMAVVQARAVVGPHAIVNTSAVVEHDCQIGANAHIAPGAVLGGGVQVGPDTLIGLGARVLPMVRIGPGATIGAGAVVTADVPAHAKAVGVPARVR